MLLSAKATSRQLEYPACCAGVVGLIWGLEKCLPPPSASSILCCVHSLPEREIVFPSVCRCSQVVMYALLQRQRRWCELSCCHSVLIWGETLALLSCPWCNTISSYLLLTPSLSPSLSLVSASLCLFSLTLPVSWFWRHMQAGERTTQSCTNWAFFVPGHCSVPRQGGLGVNPSSTQEPNWIDNVGT